MTSSDEGWERGEGFLEASILFAHQQFVDLHWFQWFGSSVLSHCGYRSRYLMTKFGKIHFDKKIANTFIPRPPWRTSKLQEKPSEPRKRTSSTSITSHSVKGEEQILHKNVLLLDSLSEKWCESESTKLGQVADKRSRITCKSTPPPSTPPPTLSYRNPSCVLF